MDEPSIDEAPLEEFWDPQQATTPAPTNVDDGVFLAATLAVVTTSFALYCAVLVYRAWTRRRAPLLRHQRSALSSLVDYVEANPFDSVEVLLERCPEARSCLNDFRDERGFDSIVESRTKRRLAGQHMMLSQFEAEKAKDRVEILVAALHSRIAWIDRAIPLYETRPIVPAGLTLTAGCVVLVVCWLVYSAPEQERIHTAFWASLFGSLFVPALWYAWRRDV